MTPARADARVHRRRRKIRPSTYLIFFCAFAFTVFAIHLPYLSLPYFWDELGQFVPAALDILRQGAWVPTSAVPNVHPPGVMAYLALVWKIFGYSIPATRAAMLLLASLTVFFTFLLAIELCRGVAGAPAFAAVLLLLADPLFYTQGMMAQLDMPAMLFTVVALLFFLQGKYAYSTAACVALVMAKETGAWVPLVFFCVLFLERQQKRATYFIAPFVPLAIWLWVLWRTTGHLFGDPGFAHYNLSYPLHPVRIALSLSRRIYDLYLANFRWIGALALIAAWLKHGLPRNRAASVVLIVGAGHVLLVSVLGGATLERYLLPVLPLLYIAMAAAFSILSRRWRIVGIAAMTAGLIASWFLNPPFPFPFENNLAMADFVQLQVSAAHVLEHKYAGDTIYTAWPLTAALRRPEFGYVSRGLRTMETSDLHESTLSRLDPAKVDVLVLYSRTWEPRWGVMRFGLVRRFLGHFYEYEPQMNSEEARRILGLLPVARWERHGQWVEIFAKPLQ